MAVRSSNKKAVHFGAGNIGRFRSGPEEPKAHFTLIRISRLPAWSRPVFRDKKSHILTDNLSRPWFCGVFPAQLWV